jgi:GPH family glycoside/pentoside/hexuronide:cation symporter
VTPASTSHAPALSPGTLASYAAGSLGSGVYSTVPTVLLLYFCTEVLGIAPAAAAAILFLPKAWAIVWDPLVGAWSDRTRSRYGRRASFMLAGTAGVALAFPALFCAPVLSPTATALYAGAAYFLMASAYSVYAVPYTTVPSEISDSAHERERILTWRMACAMVGVLVGAGVAPHLVELAGGGRHGYAAMSVVVSLTCGVAMLLASLAVRRRAAAQPASAVSTMPLLAALAPVVRHRDYRRLWFSYVLMIGGAALFLALSPYFVTRVLGRTEGDAGTALFALLAGTIVAMPLWGAALRRWNGWHLLPFAAGTFVAILAIFRVVPPSASFGATLPLYFVLGVPFAGVQLIPFALVAHIAHDAAADGSRNEGLFTGLWTAGEKLGLALGPGVAGLGLSIVGYAAGAGHQDAAALAGLQTLMVLGPAALVVAGMLLAAARRGTRPQG